MYSFYDVAQTSLADDDVAGICYLYPVGEGCGACARDETCVDGECLLTRRDTV